MSKPPFNALDLAPPRVVVEPQPGGGRILRSPIDLGQPARCLGDMLVHWAKKAPDRLFLAERAADGAWRRMTFGQVHAATRAVGQALLDRGLTPETPIAILSGNGIDNALLQLGAMQVGLAASAISPAYSLMSGDFGKLRHIYELLEPGLIYAADGAQFARAIAALGLPADMLVASTNVPDGAEAFSSLTDTRPTDMVDDAFAQVGPGTVAKVLFTSGSTGLPKGVINTQRMLCSNQQAILKLWPFLTARPPVIVDWLPWSHTFGANHNFNMMLNNGGTLYIDGGKPLPGAFDQTVANLKDVPSTIHFNVPRGFDMLIDALEKDDALRQTFFQDLDMIFYAGAALPQNLWDRMEDLSVRTRGERVRMVSAWGSTETAPMATSVHFAIERAGVIGLPAPGTAIKMTPNAGKLELRVKGPNVTPGYWKRPDLTREAFDKDGFYRIGDAGRLADPDNPAAGIVFDGRVAEDFKLMSGTWVHVGKLRVDLIAAAAPVIQDCVLTGHAHEDLGLLVFPSPAGCLSLCPGAAPDTPLADLLARTEVRDALVAGIKAHNTANPGNSTRVVAAALLATPPSIDANEITDKGYINQRAVLEARSDVVQRLYGAGGKDIIRIET